VNPGTFLILEVVI